MPLRRSCKCFPARTSGARAETIADLGRQPRLPGPLAIGLDKQAIHTHVLTSEYELCEKSDGERRMLLALPSDHASG